MGLKKQIIINTIAGWLTRLTTMAIAMIMTPLLLSALGQHDYGLWIAIGQGAGLFYLLDFGVANSVCRFISKVDAERNQSDRNAIFSTAMMYFGIGIFFVLLITLLVTIFLPDIFKLDTSQHNIARFLFIMLGLNVAVLFPLRVGRGLLQSLNRYDYIDILSLIINITQLIFVSIFYYFGILDLIFLCLISVVSSIAMEFFIFYKAMGFYPEIKFSVEAITPKYFKEFFSLGSSSLVQTFSAMLYTRGQILVVSIFIGISAVPLFSIPSSILMQIGPLIGRTGATFMPIASKMDSCGEIGILSRLSTYGVRYGLMVGLLIGGYLIIFGEDILSLWLRKTNISMSGIKDMYSILIIMVFPLILARANKGNQTILRATGDHWIVSNSLLIFSTIGLITSVLLIKYTTLGVLSVAIGWSLKAMIPEAVFFPFLVMRKYNISIIQYLRTAYFVPLVAFIPVVLFGYIFDCLISIDLVLKLGISTFLYFFIGIICTYFLCVEKNHKKMIKNYLRQKFVFHPNQILQKK